ncbi:MAG: class I SAM-dependent methyltransferase [bacterium]|nr:class I SAM-dependent methyltransferase [bacterium]
MIIDYSQRTNIDVRYRKQKADGRAGWNDCYQMRFVQINEFLARYSIPQHCRILELGCGAGNIVLYLAERGYEAFGIDLSPEAIAWAEEKKTLLGLSATFSLGNIIELADYSTDYFDCIIDGECLQMVIGSDRKQCLSNICRVLKPAGLFVAAALLLNESLQDRYYINPDNIFDPQTQCLTQHGLPYYYLSREKEFFTELNTAAFEILELKRSPPKHTDHPLIASRISVVARKIKY